MIEAKQGFWDDADVIHTYSRAQAIEDGVLVDLADNEVCRQHYKHPIAVTAEVWALIEKAINNKRACNDLNGIIHDMLYMSKTMKRMLDDSTVLFQVIITGAGRKRKHQFKLNVGPGDNAEPVITIMMPHED